MGTVVAADDPPGIAGVGIVVEAKELGGEGAGNKKRSRIHGATDDNKGGGINHGGVSPLASTGRDLA
jgi:hypothetical protein